MLVPLLAGILLAAAHGAPLPEGAVLLKKTTERDSYEQPVTLWLYRVATSYESLKKFYRAKRRRAIEVLERRESINPDYVADPADPSTSTPVLRVINLDFTSPWAAVYVRPLPDGALVAVLERKPPPEIAGESTTPERIEIPRAVFDLSLAPLRR